MMKTMMKTMMKLWAQRQGYIFGKPKWVADEYGVSEPSYTIPQRIENDIRSIVSAIQDMAKMSLVWVPKPTVIGRRNRDELCLSQFRVGGRFNDETEEHEGGFFIRIELRDFGSEYNPWSVNGLLCRFLPIERMIMISCYTPEGYYIGDINTAMFVYGRLGLEDVQPISVVSGKKEQEEAIKNKLACQVGFNPEEEKWYGWSHRAYFGYGIGHVAKEGSCETTSGWTEEYLEEHPEEDLTVPVGFEVKTMDDAKRCAVAFAESVG